MTNQPEKEVEGEGKAEKPFQFTISHIIYLTVGVALLCALWRVLNVKLVDYCSYIILSIFGVGFLYSSYSLPRVIKLYKWRTALSVTGVIIVTHIPIALIAIANAYHALFWRFFVIPFPGITISLPLTFRFIFPEGIGLHVYFMMFAQTFTYLILLGLGYKCQKTLMVSVAIGLFHLLAVGVG